MRAREAHIVRHAAIIAVAVAGFAALRDRAVEHPAAPITPAAVAPVIAARAPELPPAAPRVAIVARVTASGAPAADVAVTLRDGHGAIATARSDASGAARFDEVAGGPYELAAAGGGRASAIVHFEDAGERELPLEPAARVHGKLDGAPAGATVTLVPYDELDQPVRVTEIDAAGEFSFDDVPYGRWRVEASAPGYAQVGQAVATASAREQPVAVRMQPDGALTGSVVDASGAPVANATLVLVEQGDSGAREWPFAFDTTHTRWIFPIAGAHGLPANDSGRFGAPRLGARPAECGRGHCGLDLGHVRGSVIHAVDDGEIVSLFPVPNTEAGKVVVIQHANGLKTYYMHLDEIRPGLEIGRTIHAGDPVGLLGSTGFTRAVPHLHFAVTYEHQGRTWYLDPEPLMRDAIVLATPRAYEPADPSAPREPLVGLGHAPAPVSTLVVTDAHGEFHLDHVAPGAYVAGAFTSDLPPGTSAAFDVRSAGETTGVVVRLAAGVLVTGRVVGKDGPIAGAQVVAGQGFGETAHKIARTSTDKYGQFTLRALAGKITLSFDAAGYGTLDRAVVLDEQARDHREDVRLVIEDAQLRGQVFAPEGGAATGVSVRVVDGITRRSTVTDAQGRFALPVASGHYVVELAGGDYPAKRIAVDSDRWTELRLDAGGGARCSIVDATSRAPLAGIRVDATGPAGQTLTRTTDARGIVELRGLAAGTWTLTPRAPSFVAEPRTITVHASHVLEDVSLSLAHGATLAGVVRDRRGQRIGGAHVRIGGVTVTADADGNFRVINAPVGDVTLEADDGGREGALPLTLRAGDDRSNLTVELAE